MEHSTSQHGKRHTKHPVNPRRHRPPLRGVHKLAETLVNSVCFAPHLRSKLMSSASNRERDETSNNETTPLNDNGPIIIFRMTGLIVVRFQAKLTGNGNSKGAQQRFVSVSFK